MYIEYYGEVVHTNVNNRVVKRTPISLYMKGDGIAPGGDRIGSHVAVGTFKTGIEIWNLDVRSINQSKTI